MSKIIGATVGTPINPDKFKTPVDKIKEAVDAYMDENPVVGTPGKDAEIIGSPIYGVYNAEGVFALANLNTVRTMTVTYIYNLGDEFTLQESDGNVKTIKPHGLYYIRFADANTLYAVVAVESDDSIGMMVSFYDTEKDVIQVIPLIRGDNIPSGSGEYELIYKLSLEAEGNNFYDFEATQNNETFNLRAITMFCTFPQMTKTTIDILLKTQENAAYTSVLRRSSVTNDSKEQYYRVRFQNEGYWTGSSVQIDSSGGTNTEQGSFARNAIQGDAVGIRIATGDSSHKFAKGTIIEIWGVKA